MSDATVTGMRPWVAVMGGTPHQFKSRSGAVGLLLSEIDHWIEWARKFDHAALDELQAVRSKIVRTHGDVDIDFTIAGFTAHAGLRAP